MWANSPHCLPQFFHLKKHLNYSKTRVKNSHLLCDFLASYGNNLPYNNNNYILFIPNFIETKLF